MESYPSLGWNSYYLYIVMNDTDFQEPGKAATLSNWVAQDSQAARMAPQLKSHNLLRPHLVRPGNGRGFWQRVGALFGLLALVGILGLLLAGLVVVVVVGGAFLLETLID